MKRCAHRRVLTAVLGVVTAMVIAARAGAAQRLPVLNTEFDNLTCDANGNPASSGLSADQLTTLAKTGVDDIVPGSMAATARPPTASTCCWHR